MCFKIYEWEVVSSVADKIDQLASIPEGSIRILYEGRQLNLRNAQTDYDITKDVSISLIIGLQESAKKK